MEEDKGQLKDKKPEVSLVKSAPLTFLLSSPPFFPWFSSLFYTPTPFLRLKNAKKVKPPSRVECFWTNEIQNKYLDKF